MKSGVLLIFSLLQSGLLISQQQVWYLTRGLSGDEVAWAISTDSTGNCFWAVEQKDQWPNWYYNVVLYKIDPLGNQLWQANSWDNGTGFNDIAFVAKVKGPDVFLAGRTDSTANLNLSADALVMKYNSVSGMLSWARNVTAATDFGYQEIDGISIESEGIFLTGWTKGQTTDMDFLIQKLDAAGNTIWVSSWDCNSLGKFDGANGHMAIDNQFIYAAGHVNRSNITSLDGDGALACFSRINGQYQWHVTWGGSLYDDALGMTLGGDSMLYITGYTGSFGNGSQNYLNKYSRTGQLKWSRIWGRSGTEDSRSLVTDGDSMIYVVGATSSYGNGAKDIFILKYDTSGALLDSLFWGGAFDETAKDVTIHSGYLYITGETKSFGNGYINKDQKADGLLLKINGRTMTAPDTVLTSVQKTEENFMKILPVPNPANSVLSFQKPPGDFFVEIINSSGQLVIRMFNTNVLITSDLPEGIYFMRVISDRLIEIGKVIVQH